MYPMTQLTPLQYDMLTTPITTPYFHSRVLALLSSHLAQIQPVGKTPCLEPPAPIIPPLTPVDTPLTPNETISQLLAFASPWIDLCSPDPLIANISRQVLSLEVAYAAFCGVGNIIVPAPKLHHIHETPGEGLAQYARAIQEALSIGTYLSIQIHLPMIDHPDSDPDSMGSLSPFARDEFLPTTPKVRHPDDFGTWDAWNLIRTVCKYTPRLYVALRVPSTLPSIAVQNRWFSEPLRLLDFHPSSFKTNRNLYPVLSKFHQQLLHRYMRLRTTPWLLLTDMPPPAPSPNNPDKQRDPHPHLAYLRHLSHNPPPPTTIEKFGSGYQDYLQSPLQPLTDNLESITYEVFEKDPVKYDLYERAIALALSTWDHTRHPGSGPDNTLVLAVVGAGRGPLVTRALRAAAATRTTLDLWAVEKNPNAYVLLRRHDEMEWNGKVHVVKSDMRSWKGPFRPSTSSSTDGTHGKVDILVSELLGSFADNELSPECLDGVTHLLHPTHGISIPSSYTAHIAPIAAPRLHADISARAPGDPTAAETPYVVWLHAIDYLATTPTTAPPAMDPPAPTPHIAQTWEFRHPPPPTYLAQSALRRTGALSGGAGGFIAGSDGWNEHNARFWRGGFACPPPRRVSRPGGLL